MRLYHYIGPHDILTRTADRRTGTRINSIDDLQIWIRDIQPVAGPDDLIPATFIIDQQGDLLLADRRSEHVACAGGQPVLSAGEMFFLVTRERVELVEVSNQSTGYCPEPESWPVVAAALERMGMAHPGCFTLAVVFRRCEQCGERNVVKDGWFMCGVCGAELPDEWNFQ